MTAAALDNTGEIDLTGSGANQALLNVSGVAGFGTAGGLSGSVTLTGDSAIEFASGEISTISAGSGLSLNGNDAFIENSTALGSNSALIELASIGAGARFYLENGASLSTTGALVNDGGIFLGDINGGGGGSSLNIGGTLTNTGSIDLYGSSATDVALLDITTGVAGFGTSGTLTGSVVLANDSQIEFLSGQISTIATGATLQLGNSAFIEDSTALGSNSALAVSNVYGTLALESGASLSTTGALANDGTVEIGDLAGGSNLTVAGALTNTGSLDIGNGGLDASSSVTTKSLVNSGTVDLIGQRANLATLDVSGTTTNNGVISIFNDTEELAGAVGGTGSFSLSSVANLRFDSSVSVGQTIDETLGTLKLTLEQAQNFAGTISGFGTDDALDTIDAANFLVSATTFNFVENSAMTGGTLTLHDGSLTANIHMTGVYSNSDFSLAPDSGTGTLVKFV